MLRIWLFIAALILTACKNDNGSISSEQNSNNDNVAEEPKFPDLTLNKLLNDGELITPSFDFDFDANPNYVNWANLNHHKIRSITYDQDFSDLEFLSQELEGRRIVQLGESSHGSAEFNHAKVRLIKYLHQVLGYEVIAFESSLFSCYIANESIQFMSSTDATQSCIFGVWHTEEVRELFNYIISTYDTDRPLILAGFDVQPSSASDNLIEYKEFAAQFYSYLSNEQQINIESALGSYSDLIDKAELCRFYDDAESCTFFTENYENVKDTLTASFTDMSNIESVEESLTRALEVAKILFQSLSFNVSQHSEAIVLDQSWRYGNRDLGMASNLVHLADNIYSDKKVIVWAHNAHINNGKFIPQWPDDDLTMGQHLKEHWGDELFTIGLYMLRGEVNSNRGELVEVIPFASDSLEAIIAKLNLAALYIPIDKTQREEQGAQWLFETIERTVSGEYAAPITLSNSYDGVIVIDRSTRGVYL